MSDCNNCQFDCITFGQGSSFIGNCTDRSDNMCEFCDYYHSSKGGVSGKEIKILKCANETDLTDCQVHKGKNDNEFSVVIFSFGIAKGYFNINFCPICGRDLRSGNNDKN